MKTYYTQKKGQITASAEYPFDYEAIKTDKKIVHGPDGQLYFEGEIPDDIIKAAEVVDERDAIMLEITKIDLGCIRPIRAILRGNPLPEEQYWLDKYGQEAETLRARLREISK